MDLEHLAQYLTTTSDQLICESRIADRELHVRLTRSSECVGKITAHGPESFYLELPNGYTFAQFEWDEKFHEKVIDDLVQATLEYLAGRGTIRRWKLLTKPYSEYVVRLTDGSELVSSSNKDASRPQKHQQDGD